MSAYTRPLAKLSSPVCPSAPSEAEVKSPALIGPSSPVFTAYSSLVPTMIEGFPEPSMSATAGVSMILP